MHLFSLAVPPLASVPPGISTKSTARSVHGPSDRIVDLIGPGLPLGPTWHGWQDRIVVSTCLSIWSHQTFSFSLALVRTIPWCSSCASLMVWLQTFSDMTIAAPAPTIHPRELSMGYHVAGSSRLCSLLRGLIVIWGLVLRLLLLLWVSAQLAWSHLQCCKRILPSA